jgi:hypothetical protein
VESHHDLIPLFEHDLFGKPVSTFPDHALIFCFDAFSSREPVSTSLENAIASLPGLTRQPIRLARSILDELMDARVEARA